MLSNYINRAILLALILAFLMWTVRIAAPQKIADLFTQFLPFLFMVVYLFYIEYIVGELKDIKDKLDDLAERKNLK